MHFQRRQQKMTVARLLLEHFIVRDDLIFCFLQLHQFAKLVRLAGFPFRMTSVCGSNTLSRLFANSVSPHVSAFPCCTETIPAAVQRDAFVQ
jgi:hypothetical protein